MRLNRVMKLAYLLIASIGVSLMTQNVFADIYQQRDKNLTTMVYQPDAHIEGRGVKLETLQSASGNPWSSKSPTAPQETVVPQSRAQQNSIFPDPDYNPYSEPQKSGIPSGMQQPGEPWRPPDYSQPNGSNAQGYYPYSGYPGGTGGYTQPPGYGHPSMPSPSPYGGYGPGNGGFTTPWSGGNHGFGMPFAW